MRAGDVERNPGPECGVCGGRTSDRGPRCARCGAWVHLGCSGLKKNAFYKLEKEGEWLCGKCSPESAARLAEARDCGKCKVSFRDEANPAECVGCKRRFHLGCTGVHRYHRDNLEEWKCEECQGGQREEVVRRQQATERCDTCGKQVRADQGVTCNNCAKRTHKKCAGVGSRVAMIRMEETGGWRCQECKEEKVRIQAEGKQSVSPESLIWDKEERESKSNLRLLQWKCDYLQSKAFELEGKLQEWDVDVACLQETKLRAEDQEVRFAGYNVVRMDRKRRGMSRYTRGGGLVTLVRKGLAYQILPGEEETGMEMQRIQLLTGGTETLKVANVYIPPTRTREEEDRITWNKLPKGENWVILGDLNAHHEAWDNLVDGDERGEKVMEWVDENRLMVINDGSATREERGTGRQSTPDVTICHEGLAGRTSWTVKPKMFSDHLPVILELNKKHEKGKQVNRYAWQWKKADWEGYRKKIEDELRVMEMVVGKGRKVSDLEKDFRNVILTAAKEFIGVKKIRTHNLEVMDEDIKKEMDERDKLRFVEKVEGERVAEQERRIKEMVKEKKKEEWKKKVEESNSFGKMWGLLKRLKGKGESGKDQDTVLVHEEKGYATDKAKANAFTKEYAKVSSLKIPSRGRQVKDEVNRELRRGKNIPEEVEGREVRISEVKAALESIDGSKAAGPDFVHPRLLKELPEEGIATATTLFNLSFKLSQVPQNWRQAKIIPLLKKDKDPGLISSYRPVSLTSVIGKWMERVLNNRLRYVLESRNLLSQTQAGFRPNRTVEDQLLRLTQEISDGFQERHRSVLVLLDYSKAYDKVWRDGLLSKLIKKGISVKLLRWIQAWLSNRQAWVSYNGVEAKKKTFKEGLPQGSVLSPILFLVYIDDVLSELEDEVGEVSVSMFADDLAVWSSHRNKAEAARKVQMAVDAIARWSERWLMSLNVDKCEVSFFSMDAAEANHVPRVSINGQQLRHSEFPTFLGVTYDRMLTFREHCKRTCKKVRKRLSILRAVAGTDWGFDLEILRTTYTALCRAILEYGSAAWMPWLSKTEKENLERVQLEAGRIITGLTKSAPTEAVLIEADLDRIGKRANTLATVAYERSLRLEEENPRRRLAEKEVRQRLKKEGWRKKAKEEWRDTMEVDRIEEGWMFPKPLEPWLSLGNHEFVIEGKKVANEGVNRDMAKNKLLDNEEYDYVVYTDGSAREGRREGGAAAVITVGNFDEPEVVEKIQSPAGKWCSSYQAEMVALIEALKWLEAHQGEWRRARIVTDSRSSLDSVRKFKYGTKNTLLREVYQRLTNLTGKLQLVWVPSHCGIPGNDIADEEANEATGKDQGRRGWLYDVAKARIWQRARKRVIQHERIAAIFPEGKVKDERMELSKEEGISWRRFRSGHSLELKEYRKRIGLAEEDRCRLCGEEPETTDHIMLRCAGTLRQRVSEEVVGMGDLSGRPRQCWKIWNWFRKKDM